MFDPIARRAELRSHRAELELLEEYDRRRELAGYDYGAGQRARELTRVRRRVRQLEESLGEPPISILAGNMPTREEKRLAFELVLAPKLRRVQSESYRHGSRATDITLRILSSMRRVYEGEARVAS